MPATLRRPLGQIVPHLHPWGTEMAEELHNDHTLVVALTHRFGARPPSVSSVGFRGWIRSDQNRRAGIGDPTLWLWILTGELSGPDATHPTEARPGRVDTTLGLTSLVQCCKATRAYFGGDLRIRCYTCANTHKVTGFSWAWRFRVFSDIDGWQCRQCKWWGNSCSTLVHPRCSLCRAMNNFGDFW